mmetsp:Transcript_47242/g.93209  ORF Transcript_47242/g.93209 Transcript_47242/m.93209 type:complete len:82 (-) Transcript_47242:933-1178(-)
MDRRIHTQSDQDNARDHGACAEISSLRREKRTEDERERLGKRGFPAEWTKEKKQSAEVEINALYRRCNLQVCRSVVSCSRD